MCFKYVIRNVECIGVFIEISRNVYMTNVLTERSLVRIVSLIILKIHLIYNAILMYTIYKVDGEKYISIR